MINEGFQTDGTITDNCHRTIFDLTHVHRQTAVHNNFANSVQWPVTIPIVQ